MKRIGPLIGLLAMTVVAMPPAVRAKPVNQSSIQHEVARHFRAGQQDLRSGRTSEAVAEFQDVLRLAPGLGEAHINLGLAYHLLGRYNLAATELEKGLHQNPNALGPNIILGVDELKLGSPAKAIPPLRKAVRIDPSNQQAWSSLAEAFLALGDYLTAGRASCAAFGTSVTPDNLLHLGHAYLRMSGRLTLRMAHDDPNTAWAKRLAGDLLSERHLLSDAAQRYRLALARDPSEPGLHSALGNALLAQGNVRQAQREYQSEIKLDPASPPALLGLCEVELEEGHAGKALAYVSRLATTAPRLFPNPAVLPAKVAPPLAAQLASQLEHVQAQPGVHFLLAALYRRAGEAAQSRQQEALSDGELEQLARREQPGWLACKVHQYEACARFLDGRRHLDVAELLTLGEAHFALRQYDQAGSAFASALVGNGQDPETLYWLIRSYSKIADRCFYRLDQAYPGSAQTYELQAESYRARGEDSRAIRQYQLAAALQPGNASLHEALGDLYLSEHQLPAAHEELNKALELNPTNAHSLYLMGRVEIGLQKPQAAIGYIEEALRYDPHLLEARASLGLAYLRAGEPALAVPQLEESAALDYYGDLHYLLYQAYHRLGKTELAGKALAASQALRRKTEARDQALIHSAEDQ